MPKTGDNFKNLGQLIMHVFYLPCLIFMYLFIYAAFFFPPLSFHLLCLSSLCGILLNLTTDTLRVLLSFFFFLAFFRQKGAVWGHLCMKELFVTPLRFPSACASQSRPRAEKTQLLLRPGAEKGGERRRKKEVERAKEREREGEKVDGKGGERIS